jgi:hypothetical protein
VLPEVERRLDFEGVTGSHVTGLIHCVHATTLALGFLPSTTWPTQVGSRLAAQDTPLISYGHSSLWIGFFKGTSADQDRRFSDKELKLLKSIKFPVEFDKKVCNVTFMHWCRSDPEAGRHA